MTNSFRSNAASPSADALGAAIAGPRPITICRNTGCTATALGPTARLSVGTSRQPMTRCPSSTTICSNSRSSAARVSGLGRQEHQARAVAALLRQIPAETRRFLAEERIGDLNQDAGAVAGVDLAPARAAVLQVDQHLQRLTDDRVRAPALDISDEPDAAGIVLMSWIVETTSGGLMMLLLHPSFMNEDLS